MKGKAATVSEKSKVLVITSTIDKTIDYIEEKYRDIINICRLNVDEFYKYDIKIGLSEYWVIEHEKWKLSKCDTKSIYYRKPMLPKLDEFEPCYRNMICRDIIAVINGIVDDFDGKVLTKPYILRKTENKIYQLLYANKHNLLMPESFIGNSIEGANELLEYRSIIKPITTGKILDGQIKELYNTNYCNEIVEDISLMPIYLQRYIDKKYEVRVTFIDDNFFAVKILTEEKLDWRKDYGKISYSVIECPKDIVDKCKKILEDFELKFGAFDFIVNHNDEWVFLEVNPNGQWQWLEVATGIPISKYIIDYLKTCGD